MTRRLATTIFVTGKGGAGKTTIARALVDEAIRRGKRARVAVLAQDEAESASPGAASAFSEPVVRIGTRMALGRLLKRFLRLSVLADRLLDSRTFTAVASAAPGLSDFVWLEAVRELARGELCGPLDVVVVDAPASGHATALLAGPSRLAALVRAGPAAGVLRETGAWARDPRAFRILIACAPEEMSVVETKETREALGALGYHVAAIAVNGVYPEQTTVDVETWIRTHGVDGDARLYLDRRRRQLDRVRPLENTGSPVVPLPYRFPNAAPDLAAIAALYDALMDASGQEVA